MRRDVFQAIADPTRREILHLVSQKPLNLNGIAANFNISRPAISQHIKLLMECDLIRIRQQGRERYCEAKLEKLSEVAQWVEQYRQFWESRFSDLDQLLNTLQSKKDGNDK